MSAGQSVHVNLSKMATEPVEVVPGLLDLSASQSHRLHRAFSAPTCQDSHNLERRKVDSHKIT